MSLLISILSISLGATAGSLLRWLANACLNPILSWLPLGTLAVNLTGSLLMGMALGVFALFPAFASQLKLLIVTGFLGSLTTFSAFAGEMAAMLQEGRIVCCAAAICLHVFGSIAMVFVGLGLVNLARACFIAR